MIKKISILFLALISCREIGQRKKTPREFMNEVVVNKSNYFCDSLAIISNLYQKLKDHEASFTNSEYFDSTVLIVDTIMYDLSQKKVALFVIAKNPTYRNPYSKSKLPYYYNANCYLGKRLDRDSSLFELKQLGPFSIVNFDDLQEVKQAIRDNYFLELATVLDEKSQPVFIYNLDDKRFWDSPTGWNRMFD